ncbi:hypothetical protein T12_8754 [Trichinella patagoniensis]|uniref:Uncharacterized protein n=1 Tax=Trichinella patagoniensis TaxID=990121 RepID=A0A0V0YSA1_9BILA|nr:hypothetical protein T12_8754 [Trichinella patagoniensis]
MDECSDVESQGGSSASASRPRNSSDTIHRPGIPHPGGRMFRPEQHRPSRCDPAKGWYPEVAGGQEQYPRATGQIAI